MIFHPNSISESIIPATFNIDSFGSININVVLPKEHNTQTINKLRGSLLNLFTSPLFVLYICINIPQ